ncbi:MAG: hypothetical protein ACQPRH_05090 [Solitalea-like symbiont of Tyrophagus putrescentiae]
MKRLSLATLILFSSIFLLSFASKAQVYNTSIGIRAGSIIGITAGSIQGITYKKFIDDPNDKSKVLKSWEIHGGYRYGQSINNKLGFFRGYGVDGFYTYNNALSPMLLLHYGYGAGIAFADNSYAINPKALGLTTGLTGIVGMEYVFKGAIISLDFSFIPRLDVLYLGEIKPAIQLLAGALSIKYIIN